MVNDVDEVTSVSADQLEDMPGGGSGCVLAIAKLGERLVVLLDSAGLIAGVPAAARRRAAPSGAR